MEPDHHDVALPVDLDQLLLVELRQRALVHRVGGAGIDARHPGASGDPHPDLVLGLRRPQVVQLLAAR